MLQEKANETEIIRTYSPMIFSSIIRLHCDKQILFSLMYILLLSHLNLKWIKLPMTLLPWILFTAGAISFALNPSLLLHHFSNINYIIFSKVYLQNNYNLSPSFFSHSIQTRSNVYLHSCCYVFLFIFSSISSTIFSIFTNKKNKNIFC